MKDYNGLVIEKDIVNALSNVYFIGTDDGCIIPLVEGKSALDQLIEAGAQVDKEE